MRDRRELAGQVVCMASQQLPLNQKKVGSQLGKCPVKCRSLLLFNQKLYMHNRSSLSRARPLHCLGQRRHQQPLSRNCEYFPGPALARECQKGCGSAPLCWPPWFPWLVRPPHCFHRSIHSFSTGCQVAAYNDAYSRPLVRGAPHLPPHFRLLCLSPCLECSRWKTLQLAIHWSVAPSALL